MPLHLLAFRLQQTSNIFLSKQKCGNHEKGLDQQPCGQKLSYVLPR